MRHKRKGDRRVPDIASQTAQHFFSRSRTYRLKSLAQPPDTRVDSERKEPRKDFAQKEKLAFSSAWPAIGASLNACGTNTIGSVFFSNRMGRPKSTCSCWKRILMISAAMKSSPAKWVGRNCWMKKIGARKWTRFWMKAQRKRKSPKSKTQLIPAKRSRSTIFIARP